MVDTNNRGTVGMGKKGMGGGGGVRHLLPHTCAHALTEVS